MAHLLLLRGSIKSGKSTLARFIASGSPRVRVVEVDDIKRQRHGTSEHCVPEIDFQEAGQMAREYLAQGFDTIIVEPLCTREHLDLVIGQTGRTLQSRDVSVIWLSCSERTSVARNAGLVSEEMIKLQHSRYQTRYQPWCEHVISTDWLTPEQVVGAVLLSVPLQVADVVSESSGETNGQ